MLLCPRHLPHARRVAASSQARAVNRARDVYLLARRASQTLEGFR